MSLEFKNNRFKYSLSPQEETLKISFSKKKLSIGLLKSKIKNEKRICLTPKDVKRLVLDENEVIIEDNAGLAASFSNEKYIHAGAEIAYSKNKIFESAIILKTEPLTESEIQFLKPNQTILTALQPAARNKKYYTDLSKKQVTAICYEMFEDTSGRKPIVRAMSEIAGITSIMIAAENLKNQNNEPGVMFGGITGILPTQVVIIGAGTVGEYAVKTALGFGAQVTVFDFSTLKLSRIENLVNQRIATSLIDPETLKNKVMDADVIITAFNESYGKMPLIITEEMVMTMKPNSVIVDVSIDKGCCVETSKLTTQENPIFKKHEIIHFCVPNIPSMVSKTSSAILSKIITPLLIKIAEAGGIIPLITFNKGFRNSIYMYKGAIINQTIAESYELPYKNIDLLILGEKY